LSIVCSIQAISSAPISFVFAAIDPLFHAGSGGGAEGGLTAPMPGKVIALIAAVGARVEKGAALLILEARGNHLGLHQPWHFFWVTGALSSFLDNAPTYLAFASVASGQAGISIDGPRYLADYLAAGGMDDIILKAIACGAVMMGAMTYIGNGPNFMVKAIAEENGIKMPSFFGYMAWSCALLIPCFLIVTFVFFRGSPA
jgi:Na+/H+ antiporter NhaD/arsenite permease-like protein